MVASPTMTVEISFTAVPRSAVLTRSQFVSMVVDHLYTKEQIDYCFSTIGSYAIPDFTKLYTDVSTSAQNAQELCIAMRDGLATGFDDGSFRPNRSITLDEASKILARAYDLAPQAELKNLRPWFRPYVQALANRHAIPVSVTGFHHRLREYEANDMMKRISDGITWMPSMTYVQLEKLSVPVRLPVTSDRSQSLLGGSNSSNKSSGSSKSAVPWYKFF